MHSANCDDVPHILLQIQHKCMLSEPIQTELNVLQATL
ncbi:hypothetical protein VVMO6_01451 [Vibrio vulnificus MO6-24/O]|nr:hypothetical protein VVMO6_01451 [Vibrio vulnificus MO6-24/O]